MTDQPPYLVRIGLIQEDAGKLLFYMLPEDGWTNRTLEYRKAGPVGESLLTATFPDGRTESLEVPSELIRVMNELRHEMASLGKGAWFSTVLSATSGGNFRFSFNYDDKPGVVRAARGCGLHRRFEAVSASVGSDSGLVSDTF